MKNTMDNKDKNVQPELTALAEIFGDFLKRKSVSRQDLMELIGQKLVTARKNGDSFIIPDDKECEALNANPQLITGEKALLVLEEKRLYLYREHQNETDLAKMIAERLVAEPPHLSLEESTIRKAFRRPPNDDQFNAVCNCLKSNFSMITGGPGTGKTTIIAALAALELERDPGLIIEIAAPTGKAAELLTLGLAAELPQYQFKAKTVHTLFKALPGTGQFRKNASDPLECDLLIVDECSMIDLNTAAQMFHGIKPETRVVLSGDHRQLEAIGSGAVLASLLTFVNDGTRGAQRLKKAGTELTENFRSRSAKTIQGLAKMIRDEHPDEELCKEITGQSESDYRFCETSDRTGKEILAAAIDHWQSLPRICSTLSEENQKEAFEVLKGFRIVTAARVGKEGCDQLNTEILKALKITGPHSPGSALLITQNCRRTGLANGDVGIAFADRGKGGIKVCFEHRTPLPLHELPPAESAFAMTVHKAQGSGFDELCFPMPQKETPLLTRELFYTALTRAARKITVYGSEKMVLAALKNRSCRNTALAERIVEILNTK